MTSGGREMGAGAMNGRPFLPYWGFESGYIQGGEDDN